MQARLLHYIIRFNTAVLATALLGLYNEASEIVPRNLIMAVLYAGLIILCFGLSALAQRVARQEQARKPFIPPQAKSTLRQKLAGLSR